MFAGMTRAQQKEFDRLRAKHALRPTANTARLLRLMTSSRVSVPRLLLPPGIHTGLLREQEEVLRLLSQTDWEGPCSVYIMLKRDPAPKLAIMFGEMHGGKQSWHRTGIVRFFQRISSLPINFYIEESEIRRHHYHLDPTGKDPIFAGKETNEGRAGLIFNLLLNTARHRTHLVDARDCIGDATPAIIRLVSSNPQDLGLIMWVIEVAEALKGKADQLASKFPALANQVRLLHDFTRQTVELMAGGRIKEDDNRPIELLNAWMNICAVGKMSHSTYPTIIGYFGNSHVFNLEESYHSLQIVPLLERLGYKIFASSDMCRPTDEEMMLDEDD